MGIHLSLINTDDLYNNTNNKKIILNDINNRTTYDTDIINNLLMLEVGEEFTMVPRCACGKLSMEMYKGIICPECQTEVDDVISDTLDSKIWIRAPEGVPALMNVKMWEILLRYLNKSNFNLLKWLTDTDYKPNGKIKNTSEKILLRLNDLGLNIRSYENFYNRFDEYLDFFTSLPVFSNFDSKKSEEIKRLFTENKDKIWVKYIPIPNKGMYIVEKSNGKKWIDSTLPSLLLPLRLITGIDNPGNDKMGVSKRTKLNRVSRCLSLLSEYYNRDVAHSTLGQKTGIIRRHVLATRSHFTSRFVVTAINGPHEYDEIRLPWIFFTVSMAPHIRAKLYNKYKLSAKEVTEIITKYEQQYHPLIHSIINELVNESVNEEGKVGISLALNRNPSLKHGSIVRLRGSLKTKNGLVDVRDLSAATSANIASWYNGDYDGDQENLLLLLDNKTTRAFEPFEARYSVTNITDPYKMDGNINLPKQTTLSINNCIHSTVNPTKEELKVMDKYRI